MFTLLEFYLRGRRDFGEEMRGYTKNRPAAHETSMYEKLYTCQAKKNLAKK